MKKGILSRTARKEAIEHGSTISATPKAGIKEGAKSKLFQKISISYTLRMALVSSGVKLPSKETLCGLSNQSVVSDPMLEVKTHPLIIR